MPTMKKVTKPKLAAPKPITAEDVAIYHANKTEIDRLTKENDAISKRIKTQYEPDTYEVGDFVVELTKTIGTLNKAAFTRDYPVDEFPELYESVPSTEAIKNNLEDEREDYYTPVLRLSIKAKA